MTRIHLLGNQYVVTNVEYTPQFNYDRYTTAFRKLWTQRNRSYQRDLLKMMITLMRAYLKEGARVSNFLKSSRSSTAKNGSTENKSTFSPASRLQ